MGQLLRASANGAGGASSARFASAHPGAGDDSQVNADADDVNGPTVVSGSAWASSSKVHELTRSEIRQEAVAFRDVLVSLGARVLGTLLDNSPAWAVTDEAAALGEVVHVPLPLFFTEEQTAHALRAAGVDTLLVPSFAAARWPLLAGPSCRISGESFSLLHIDAARVPMPAGTAKITFTSGSTGAPKGVCLSADSLVAVRDGLVEALRPLHIERHLCALPLAVLLENVAGLMAPMAAGASCIVLPLVQLGLGGSSSFDPERFHAAVLEHEPNSLILLPQMLRAWVGFLARTGRRAPSSLGIVAVGGAAVGAPLLAAARGLGIPAYEGYGLSEGASVQTLNLPGADRAGSAGRPLPHARVRIAADGEIEVGGSLFSGYLGHSEAPASHWWRTGDLGSLDADGFLHVTGRKKNVLITGFGRNVAPEWVETALRSESAVAEAVVFGDGEPALSAVVWPSSADRDDAQLQGAVDAANATLPDYARVRRWTRAHAAFNADSGFATSNGRPQRAAIWKAHRESLTQLPDGGQ
jgi:long-chain acyl-CoA synthetase